MRSTTNHSRARLAACGLIAPTLAAVAIAGCGVGDHTPTTATSGRPTARAGATAHSAATHERGNSAAGEAAKAAHSSASGAHGDGKPASNSSPAAVTANAKTSAGVAARRGTSTGARRPATAAASPSTPRIGAGAVLKTLAGTGNASLGLLSEKTTTVLQWSAASSSIEIFTSQGFRLVSSQASSGRVRLTAGKYPGLRVSTKGPWKIELRAVA